MIAGVILDTLNEHQITYSPPLYSCACGEYQSYIWINNQDHVATEVALAIEGMNNGKD